MPAAATPCFLDATTGPPKHDGIETFAIERGRACGYFFPLPDAAHDQQAGYSGLCRPGRTPRWIRHTSVQGLRHWATACTSLRAPTLRPSPLQAPATRRWERNRRRGDTSPIRWWLHRRRPVCGNSRCPPSWVEARSTPGGGFWVSRRWRVLPGEAWTVRRGGLFRSPRRQGTRPGGCGIPQPPGHFWNGFPCSLRPLPYSIPSSVSPAQTPG